MTTALTDRTTLVPQVVIQYDVSEEQIARLALEYSDQRFDDPAAYAAGTKAIAHVRGLRTSVEATRKDLKEDSLKLGRRIDAEAKKLTTALEAIEQPLKDRKAAIDDAKENARRAAEETARLEREAAAKKIREEEEARIKLEGEKLEAQKAVFLEAQRVADAERAQREATEKAEREKVAAEQRAAQEKIDAARRELEAKQDELDRAEKVRTDRIEAEKRDAERIERERVEEIARADRNAIEEDRIKFLRPEIEKVRMWGGAIREFAATAPAVESPEARASVAHIVSRLMKIADGVEAFTPTGSAS